METITLATLNANTVYVPELPNCDLCVEFGETHVNLAEFDGATKLGPWANMCMDHFKRYGIGLGTGRGQHLRPVTSRPAKRTSPTKGRKWLTATVIAKYRYANCEQCEMYFDASTPDMSDEDRERGYPACWSVDLDRDASNGIGYSRHLIKRIRRTRTERTDLKRTFRTNQH